MSFGGYQPGNVVTNDDIAARVETSDEWIRSRVGVVSRRFAGPDESVADMAVVASGKALAASGLSPADINLVIVASCSTEAPIPNAQPAVVAHRLGVAAPGAYDLNAACAGFCYALANASDAVRRLGPARGDRDEKMTAWIDPDDRSTCIIFADGAGAAVIGPVADGEPPGIGPVVWGGAGNLADKIAIPDRYSHMYQEGQGGLPVGPRRHAPHRGAGAASGPGVRGERPGGVRAASGEPADHRGHRAQARRTAGAGGRRHRARGQHVLGVDPAGAVPDEPSGGTSSRGSPALLLGFGAGMRHAAQVITVP